MALNIYNSLGNRKEPFVPIEPGRVRLYLCGVTVYDLCHIGHARANVAFDIIVRYLRFSGLQVTFVRNFTDIDDKIIRRANEQGTDYLTISNRYIEAFYEDFDRMGLLRPDIEPRATGHIAEMIALCERLIGAGKAYPAPGGDVYFRVRSFPDYTKLSGKQLDELQAGARVEVGEAKEDPLDFALWKGSKPGEPSWESPWGPGRPGWHIECSAMAMKHLGETIDIHGGGKDLKFPHHENEIAQTEGATGKPFARYWVHNGFVNVNSEKMSKSLGNFFTLREVLKAVKPEVLRFFFASSHYRSDIDYCDGNLAEARAGLDRFYRVKEKAEGYLAAGAFPCAIPPGDDFAALREAPARFREAMDDDFNTAAAMGHLFDAVRALNKLATDDPAAEAWKAGAFLSGFMQLNPLFEVLGLLRMPSADYFRSEAAEGRMPEAEILARIEARREARARKDYAEGDRIRKELDEAGVLLEDGKGGTTWKYKD